MRNKNIVGVLSMLCLCLFADFNMLEGFDLEPSSIAEAKVVRRVVRHKTIKRTAVDTNILERRTANNKKGKVIEKGDLKNEEYINLTDDKCSLESKDSLRSNIMLGSNDVLKGDVDGNGKLSLTDLSILKRHLVYDDVLPNETNADINSDGKITSTDLSLLKQMLVGSESNDVKKCKEFVPSERYYIVSSLDNNKVLDVSGGSSYNRANIQIWDRNNSFAQVFLLQYDNGFYTIQNSGSKKYMDVAGGESSSGVNVWQYEKNNTAAQKWVLEPAGEGYYYIRSALGYYLDISSSGLENGSNVFVFNKSNSGSQKFKFINHVYHEYYTVNIDFSTLDEWKTKIREAEFNVMGLRSDNFRPLDFSSESGSVTSNFQTVNGKYVDNIRILGYKALRVWYEVNYLGVKQKKYVDLRVPNKIEYRVHKHDYQNILFFNMSYLTNTVTCTCGYREEWRWDVPWDDANKTIEPNAKPSVVWKKFSPFQ